MTLHQPASIDAFSAGAGVKRRTRVLSIGLALLVFDATGRAYAAPAASGKNEVASDKSEQAEKPGPDSKDSKNSDYNHAPRASQSPHAPDGETKRDLDPKQAAELFNDALQSFHSQAYASAAAQFYVFISHSPATTDNYGWGQYLLAQSLDALGLTYAAQVYDYLVAKTRSQPEIIGDALAKLEEYSRNQAIDEELIYRDLIYEGDFGVLPPALASWVAYVQGRYDYQHGQFDWGDRHFNGVDKQSPYSLEATYVKAVQAVRSRKDSDAMDMFRSILASPVDAPAVKNRSQLAVARLLFERAEYAQAMQNYDKVQQIDLSFEQAEILTEKAWSAYYLKDYPRALGLLHALHAPSYDNYFFPETYLLTGLIFKDLCHYLAAKNTVRAYRFKFGRSLEQLKQRLPMERIERIRLAATREGPIARRTRLLQTLRQEHLKIADYGAWERPGLQKHLRTLYESASKTHDRLWHEEFAHEADVVALRLLDTVEQVNLLDFEVSLDIYKPLDDRAMTFGEEKLPDLPDPHAHDYYEFDGEYWNEELSHYQFYITSRCFGREQ